MSTSLHRPPRRTALVALFLALLALCSGLGCEAAPAPRPAPAPQRTVPERVLILMHGRGAAADDLQPLADELAKAAPKVKFMLPAAPLPFGRGLAWYPRATDVSPAEFDLARVNARTLVMDIVKRLRTEGVRDEQIYVGGFSQGASVAADLILSDEGSKLGGLVSLSGGVFDLDLTKLQRRTKLRAFVSHGTADTVLDSARSKQLVTALEQHGDSVRFVEFDGGHAIPPTVRNQLGAFLTAD